MRRALASLKYVPAVLCGLLVVAWVGSPRIFCGVTQLNDQGLFKVVLLRGNLILHCDTFVKQFSEAPRGTNLYFKLREHPGGYTLGCFRSGKGSSHPPCRTIEIPIPFVLTFLAPVAIAPFTRFPLWSYFAWTALLAAELAYYLR